MSKSLLDTDVLSEIIKGKNASIVAKAKAYLAEYGQFTKVMKRGDGASWLILEEADDEASEKQNALCDTTAAEVVNTLPAVKRKMVEASAQADKSNGRLTLGGYGPQDLSAPDEFSATMYLQGDGDSEPVMTYIVDREGHLTVLVGHEGPVNVPPAALRKVAQACRR